jgi:23S rRNA (uracil1939-C5)-methyltransferase
VAALLQDSLQGVGALVLDPPRKGLDPAVLSIIETQPPRSVLYISCDPSTLARDLGQLCREDGPYRLDRVQPFDFFPQTSHVETVAVLQRR